MRRVEKKNKKYFEIALLIFLVVILFALEKNRIHGDIYEINYRLMTETQRNHIRIFSSIYTALIVVLLYFIVCSFWKTISYLISFRVGGDLLIFIVYLILTGVIFYFGFYSAIYLIKADSLLNRTGEVIISGYVRVLAILGIMVCNLFREILSKHSEFK